MNLQDRKQELLNFIVRSFSEDDFRRGLEANPLSQTIMGFASYQEFLQHQAHTVNQFNETSVGTMEFVKDQLLPRTNIMDADEARPMRTTGFCFDHENVIIIIMISNM